MPKDCVTGNAYKKVYPDGRQDERRDRRERDNRLQSARSGSADVDDVQQLRPAVRQQLHLLLDGQPEQSPRRIFPFVSGARRVGIRQHVVCSTCAAPSSRRMTGRSELPPRRRFTRTWNGGVAHSLGANRSNRAIDHERHIRDTAGICASRPRRGGWSQRGPRRTSGGVRARSGQARRPMTSKTRTGAAFPFIATSPTSS